MSRETLQDLIATSGDRLTPTDRRIAEVVLAEPTLLAFGTVSDVATRAETSRPSVVRFAGRLGFGGYADLQGWIRGRVARQISSPSRRIREPHAAAGGAAAVGEALRRAVESIDADRVAAMAVPLAAAETVFIVSGETSLAGAMTAVSGLSMVRPGVQLIDEHTAARSLSGAGPGDAGLVFDFARYRRHAVETTRSLADAGARVVAVTDSPLSPLVGPAVAWCELTIPAVGPFDSSVPAVAAAELLVARVAGLLGEAARARIDRLESHWRSRAVFVAEPGERAGGG